MSSVPTTVDIERGSPLEGDRLTLAQQEQLYHDGFVVLKRVVSKELTARARQRIFDPTSEQRDLATGSSPEVLNLINKSPFADVIRNTIGDFDSPTFTQVAITPANTSSNRAYHPTMRNGEAFNLLGHPEEGFPFYNATIHMDGLTTCAQLHTDKDGVATGTPEEVYLNYINGPWSKRGEFGRYGRHAENYGANGGMLFMDRECSLSTGSFTAFAVVALNDQTEPGRGQFTVLRGSHHAMEKFYQMQIELGGIVGPEGPGWPRLDLASPSRSGLVYVPEIVRQHFLDERAETAPDCTRWPQGTQCCVEEGDAILTMHAIPHSGSRNEWTTPRMNMIWRIRAKKRQPKFVHNGATDHPDRGSHPLNGEWLHFEQDESPYFPGEIGNDPHARSKYALSHIWHEWDGMAEVVAKMKAKEEAGLLSYPRGAGKDAVAQYSLAARNYRHALDHVPWTPNEACAWWNNYMMTHPNNRWHREKNEQDERQRTTRENAKL